MAKRNKALEQKLEKQYGAKIISRVLDGRTYRLAKPGGKPFNVVVVRRSLKHKTPFQKAQFKKKMQHMQKLGEKGKLKKNLNPRSGNVQAQYRRDMQAKINRMPPGPARTKAQNEFNMSDADHKHELQADGKDVKSNMDMLESRVNSSSGSQIKNGLKNLSNGDQFRIFVERW